MKKSYEEAQAKSYSNQEGGITIPSDQLNGIVRIPLGFQPLGIASKLAGNKTQIAIAAYFEPAICLATVSRDEKGLHFEIDWIRGVNHGIDSVRLFPDMLIWGEANRAQTVNFGPNGTLWVSRNADREFFILSPPIDPKAPPTTPEGRWTLTDKLTLSAESNEMVHSALHFLGNRLLTIEANSPFVEWHLCRYDAVNGELKERKSNPAWMYGPALQDNNDNDLWSVTDFRSEDQHGIYCESKLVIPDIYGNGICFLPDGSALVTIYGQAHSGPFNGQPGQLAYVPKNLFV